MGQMYYARSTELSYFRFSLYIKLYIKQTL
jgi:hypothetical protein